MARSATAAGEREAGSSVVSTANSVVIFKPAKPPVVPEAAERLSGTHGAGAWEWVPALRFASAGTTRKRGAGDPALRDRPCVLLQELPGVLAVFLAPLLVEPGRLQLRLEGLGIDGVE